MEKHLNFNTLLIAIVLGLTTWSLKTSVESGKDIVVLQSNVNDLKIKMTEMNEFRARLTAIEIELAKKQKQ